MATNPNFTEIFNRLCHMVVLSKESRLTAVIDDLVLTAMTLNDQTIFSNDELIDLVSAFLELNLPAKLIQDSIDRLQSSGGYIIDLKEWMSI